MELVEKLGHRQWKLENLSERFKIQHFQAEIKIISTCLLFYLVIFLLLLKFSLLL